MEIWQLIILVLFCLCFVTAAIEKNVPAILGWLAAVLTQIALMGR